MLRSSANNIVLRGDGTVETTPLIASGNRVPLKGGALRYSINLGVSG